MNGTMKSKGVGIAVAGLLAALLIVAAIAPAMGAVEDAADGNGTRDTVNLGSLFTDGRNEIATATCVGDVTVQAGYNTFCASWQNINDAQFDGRGATFRVRVWDAAGTVHTATKSVNQADSGTLCVSFNSQGAGDAQYEIYCNTHNLYTIKASDSCGGDLDYT